MKITRLELENVKRIHAVDISPSGGLQVIGGKNGAGKSSVLDGLWLALGGANATRQTDTTKPVREGAETAVARLHIGDLIVERRWKAGGTGTGTVTVTTADGAAYKSPQAMLNQLTANVGIDPLAFTLLDDRKQVETLLGLVTLPFDPLELDREREKSYTERTESNRLVNQYRERLTAFVEPPEDLPDEELNLGDLLAEYTAAQQAEGQRAEDVLMVKNLRESAERSDAEADALEQRVRELRGRADTQRAEALSREGRLPDEDESTDRVIVAKRALDNVETTNRAVRHESERQKGLAALENQQLISKALTREIEHLDKRKEDALSKAEFPGGLPLGFADGAVTLNGVPFKQASSAEQIRTSIAMGMALNPKLRTLFIKDGSLLDADNMALIAEMAEAGDYQILVERVGDADKGAIVIEDGGVRGAQA